MKLNKIVAALLAIVMVMSLAACGGETPDPSESQTPSTSTPATDPQSDTPADPVVTDGDVSVDFEDGNYGFAAVYDGRANADASTLEVVESYGNKALKVTNGSGKVPYVAIDVLSLLGENAANVKSVEMTLGVENPDGKFYACSGNLIMWDTSKLSSTTHGWSVYLESKNPKTAVFTLEDYEAFSAENSVAVLTLDTDNGASAGAANANLYIYNITFKDASGAVIAADSSAAFAAPEGFAGEKDMSNLKYLKNTVSLDGMSGISGDAWDQNGVEMTEDFIAALVPGAVIEIEYTTTSATGDLWIVMPWATAGWIRVEQQSATKNNSKNICQITYEQIAAACASEDVSTWGAMFQCESDGNWTVYSVKVGQDSGLVQTTNKTAIDGFSCTGDAWGQTGFELTAEQWALMQPGAIIEVEYNSATGNLWAVMPWAEAGWMRINADNGATPICNGSKLQVTYEQIAAICGDDVTKWGAMLQFESDSAWEVYSVTICGGSMKDTGNSVEIDGFSCSEAAWNQNGFELSSEQWALMVPGSVMTVQYNSEDGTLWAVLPWAEAGWKRINADNGITPIYDGSVLQVTYEQIAEVCGDDVSKWGAMLQFESGSAWEVYSVSISAGSGTTEAPEAGGEDTPDEGGEETPETPSVEVTIPAVPEGSTELYSGTTPMTGWQNVCQVNTTVWGGTVDPASFTAGGTFSVYFTGADIFSVHFIFNGATWAQVDCELANATDLGDGTYVATFTVEDMIAVYGEDLSTVGAVHVCSNSDAAGYVVVTLVTYNPAA